MAGHFLGFTVPVVKNQIITDVWVTAPTKNTQTLDTSKVKPYKALWDTGASTTCISQQLASLLKLDQISTTQVHTAAGLVPDCPVYAATIYMPNHIVFAFQRMTRFSNPVNEFDLLIGMDIISQMDFSISNNGKGEVLASFRCPSQGHIDYSKLIPIIRQGPKIGRNDKCPCGSGEVYKKCCGKAA